MTTLLIKSLPAIEVLKEARCEVSTITSGSVDRQGDIIRPEGLDWTPFYDKGSKVNVSHSSLVVGRALWVKSTGTKVLAKTKYDDRPEGWSSQKVWYPDVVFEAVCKGVMPGKSIEIAIDPSDIHEPTEEEAKAGAKRVIAKALVNEFSVCRIPVNPDAVVEELQKALDALENPVLEESEDLVAVIGRAFELLMAGGGRA